MALNTQQTRVAISRDAQAVVLAGAGTGKTTTCIAWVESLLKEGLSPKALLMLTYTRKAAAEMQKRVTPFLPAARDGKPYRLAAGTYHFVASKLIRHDPKGFGLNEMNFLTLDDEGSSSLWRNAFKSVGVMPRQDKYQASEIKNLVSYCVNTRTDLTASLFTRYGEEDGAFYEGIVSVYRGLKRELHALDFDDLLEYLLFRLQRDSDYAAMVRERWRFVLVDEAQDNNRLQFDLLSALAPQHLLLVGDLNQSIYAFRGANHRLMQDIVEQKKTVTYTLALNYRSAQNILDLANTVISDQPHAVTLEAAKNIQGKILAFAAPTLEVEASGVVEWLTALVRSGIPHEEIAVIARSSRILTPLESLLRQRRMPYRKYGGVSISDAQEVKEFLSILRLTFAPNDRLSLMRALMLFPGLGELKIEAWLKKEEPHEAVSLFSMESGYPPQARDLGIWLSHLAGENSPGKAGTYLLNKITPLLKKNYPKDHAERLERLTLLVSSMQETEMGIPEFVDSFTVAQEIGVEHPEGHFTLSTIHSIKGLEFDAVSVMGLSDLQMPSPRARHTPEAIAEERRLLYVALTRARKYLRLSMARREVGQNALGEPTPFLPDTLIKWKGAAAYDTEYSQEVAEID